jgi:hypothetical protein
MCYTHQINFDATTTAWHQSPPSEFSQRGKRTKDTAPLPTAPLNILFHLNLLFHSKWFDSHPSGHNICHNSVVSSVAVYLFTWMMCNPLFKKSMPDSTTWYVSIKLYWQLNKRELMNFWNRKFTNSLFQLLLWHAHTSQNVFETLLAKSNRASGWYKLVSLRLVTKHVCWGEWDRTRWNHLLVEK